MTTTAAINIIPFLIYIGFFFFIIYFFISILNYMRQRNDVLKELRDELKKSNRDNY